MPSKFMRITEWLDSTERFPSQYGFINAYEWAENEVKRINSKAVHVKLVEKTGKDGVLYVAVQRC